MRVVGIDWATDPKNRGRNDQNGDHALDSLVCALTAATAEGWTFSPVAT